MNRASFILNMTAALALALTLLSAAGQARAKRPVRTTRTIAHECLEREFRAAGTDTASSRRGAFALLDALIADVARRLPARINTADPAQARNALAAIDRALTERRFYVVMPTPALLDTLTPSSPPKRANRLLTDARRRTIGRAPGIPCHRMDCDTGSILYASIGEALKLPIVLVEVPGHKFVRWRLIGRKHINWDTNAAREYRDQDFRSGRTLTYKTTITRSEEAAGRFLTELTRKDVLGYHRNIVAGILEQRGRFPEAAAEYRAALSAREHDSLAANNLAWLYLSHPQPRSPENSRAALQLALRATATLPRNRDYQDTLARAFAANGRFEEAIAAEKRAHNNRSHIALFKKRRAY